MRSPKATPRPALHARPRSYAAAYTAPRGGCYLPYTFMDSPQAHFARVRGGGQEKLRDAPCGFSFLGTRLR